MNELNNSATANGKYNNIPTMITSNISVVNLVEGLSIKKEADKQNWSGGNLTYTITVSNDAEQAYETPIVTDTIDTDLVKFVENSVTIDGQPADTSRYQYDAGTHTLSVTLDTIQPTRSTTLTFRVSKNS